MISSIKWKKNRSKPYCQHCKRTKVKLMVNSVSGKGKKSYMCRSCNTRRLKLYRSTANGKRNVYKSVCRSIEKFKHKQRARKILYCNLKKGLISKPKICSSCKKHKKLEGHHEDYNKPLDVIWVCRSCHFDIEKTNN